jgi:membrane protein involved in colicin uptake
MKEAAAASAAAKAEEEKKEHEDIFGGEHGEGAALKGGVPESNVSGEDAGFDDTLENLMTIDESGAGASMAKDADK